MPKKPKQTPEPEPELARKADLEWLRDRAEQLRMAHICATAWGGHQFACKQFAITNDAKYRQYTFRCPRCGLEYCKAGNLTRKEKRMVRKAALPGKRTSSTGWK